MQITVSWILYVIYKQNKKWNSEQWKLKQTSVHTSTYSHGHHDYAMHVSMYPYKEIFTLTSIAWISKENANKRT